MPVTTDDTWGFAIRWDSGWGEAGLDRGGNGGSPWGWAVWGGDGG